MLFIPCSFYSGCGFTKITHDVFILPMCTIWHHRVSINKDFMDQVRDIKKINHLLTKFEQSELSLPLQLQSGWKAVVNLVFGIVRQNHALLTSKKWCDFWATWSAMSTSTRSRWCASLSWTSFEEEEVAWVGLLLSDLIAAADFVVKKGKTWVKVSGWLNRNPGSQNIRGIPLRELEQ